MASQHASSLPSQRPAEIHVTQYDPDPDPLLTEEEKMTDTPPVHPVACMQAAFEESMIETTNDIGAESAKVFSEKVDSATRRRILLEQEIHEETHAARWRQKPGERFHPLWKIVAQIAFGVHLLHKRLAKSDEEVIKILQNHVDDVDGFLERTTDDFNLAIGDIDDRMRYLALPLEHGDVFDNMLAEREFRIQIVEGNEKIEHIINRTATAMTDALQDVKQGLEAAKELARYVIHLDVIWINRTEELEGVYSAMKGNAEGWYRAFVSLQSKGDNLGLGLNKLGAVVAELQKRAGIASRKAIPSMIPASRSTASRSNASTTLISNGTSAPFSAPRHSSTRGLTLHPSISPNSSSRSPLYPTNNSPTSSVSSHRSNTRGSPQPSPQPSPSAPSALRSPHSRSPRKSPLNPASGFQPSSSYHSDSAYVSGNSLDSHGARAHFSQNPVQQHPPLHASVSSPNLAGQTAQAVQVPASMPIMRRGNSRLDSYVTKKASMTSMGAASARSGATTVTMTKDAANGDRKSGGRRRSSLNFIKMAFHRKKSSKMDSAPVMHETTYNDKASSKPSVVKI
ncbi:MAG: hypothetical protein M1814_003811 [Vezdaea aestivalis]|nr:MAG: hypothetical protein M1814_003811 [Vezdaea aestivalis]